MTMHQLIQIGTMWADAVERATLPVKIVWFDDIYGLVVVGRLRTAPAFVERFDAISGEKMSDPWWRGRQHLREQYEETA